MNDYGDDLQLHLNHVVPERPKEGISLYIELEKHELDQIIARNIRVYLEKRIAFWEYKSYGVSEEKRTGIKISVIKIYLQLANSSNHSWARLLNI